MLTTGQMIDKLKVGEVAENLDGVMVKNINERLFYVDENEEVKGIYGSSGIPILNGVFRLAKWTIKPNYASFEEAMKALKEGSPVTLHADDGYVFEPNGYIDDDLGAFSIKEILENDWSIGDNT